MMIASRKNLRPKSFARERISRYGRSEVNGRTERGIKIVFR